MSETLKISIGVFAENEVSGLASALESILKQSVFRSTKGLDCETELIVMACGCTELAVQVADDFLKKARLEFTEGGPVRLRLEVVPEAGRANAWNLLTHTFSRADADYLYFVDASIVMDQPDAFEMMLRRLQRDYAMKVIVPSGNKQFPEAKGKGWCDRLNLAVTRLAEKARTTPAQGPCFCARAPALRAVWLPKHFPGTAESCFRRMIASDLAASQDNPARIGLALNASCTFEAGLTIRELYACRVRQFVGQTFLAVLMRHLKVMRDGQPKLNLTAYLRVRDETDATWLHRLVQLDIHVNGLFETMPSLWARFRFWRNPDIGSFKKLARLIVAVVAFIFDVPAFFTAAWRLKTGRLSGGWKDTHNQDQRAE